MTAAGDVCKGILAVCIGRWLFSFSSGGSFSPYLGVYLAGILAVVGHTKPIYFGFKGGKGILSGGTIAILMDWRIALVVWGGFLVLACLIAFMQWMLARGEKKQSEEVAK
jgi:glycerol-3-phosphate acyltransferase PlsY